MTQIRLEGLISARPRGGAPLTETGRRLEQGNKAGQEVIDTVRPVPLHSPWGQAGSLSIRVDRVEFQDADASKFCGKPSFKESAMNASTVSCAELQRRLHSSTRPVLIDVRPPRAFTDAEGFVQGALRRKPDEVGAWAATIPEEREIVLYCDDGLTTSPEVASALASSDRRVHHLEGGLRAWLEFGGAMLSKPRGRSTLWVTRARPKIDRVACPWLILRFVDAEAAILYVQADEVKRVAEAERALAFDIPDVTFSHEGPLCSFDAFLKVFGLGHPALLSLAVIIRGADTGQLDLAPEAPGLLALAIGLSRLSQDDQEVLRHGMTMYDALYLWSREGRAETHRWNPDLYR